MSTPGNAIDEVFEELNIKKTRACGPMKQRMNRWGWEGCLGHLPAIVSWFRAAAEEQNVSVDTSTMKHMLRQAWQRLQQAQPPQPPQPAQ